MVDERCYSVAPQSHMQVLNGMDDRDVLGCQVSHECAWTISRSGVVAA